MCISDEILMDTLKAYYLLTIPFTLQSCPASNRVLRDSSSILKQKMNWQMYKYADMCGKIHKSPNDKRKWYHELNI